MGSGHDPVTGPPSPPLVSVTVAYHPDLGMLERQMRRLPEDCLKVVVDNASPPHVQLAIGQLLATFANTMLHLNRHNAGLAAALNQGVRLAVAARPDARRLLLLDQDSEPAVGSIATLLAAYEQLARAGVRVGCVGPELFDPGTGMTHGFHVADGWLWRRVLPGPGASEPVPCTNLNGSGTLMSIELFRELDGLDESLFIDHVDTEWAFRVLAHGRLLFGIPGARFVHPIGIGSRRIWLFGWRVWPERAPHRHRFLFRNTVTLMQRSYVPAVWKFWAGIKMLLTLHVVMVVGPQRRAQLLAMVRGALDGIHSKGRHGTPG